MAARRNTIRITIRGERELQEAIRRYPEKVQLGVRDGLEAIGLMVQNEAREKVLKGPKTGRRYKKSAGVVHQASSPGEAPASDTGTLVRSIISEVDQGGMEVTVSAGTFYAKILEYGTRLMGARPFLLPSLNKIRSKAGGILKAYIRRRLS